MTSAHAHAGEGAAGILTQNDLAYTCPPSNSPTHMDLADGEPQAVFSYAA